MPEPIAAAKLAHDALEDAFRELVETSITCYRERGDPMLGPTPHSMHQWHPARDCPDIKAAILRARLHGRL